MKTRSMVFFDWAMRDCLREEANFEILEGFLSELMHRNIIIKSIEDAEVLVLSEAEVNRKDNFSRFNEVEILAEADQRELIVIELIYGGYADYFFRHLYGVSKNLSDYRKKGDRYSDVQKIYSINIAYYSFNAGKDYLYHGTDRLIGHNTKRELYLDDYYRELIFKAGEANEYYLIQPKKFEKNDPENSLEEWIFYLKKSKIRDEFTAKGMEKARRVLLYGNLTDEEIRQYERSIDNDRQTDSILYTAYRTGLREGVEKRVEKANGEAIPSKSFVFKCKKAGYSIDDISKYTGFSPEQINEIIENNG